MEQTTEQADENPPVAAASIGEQIRAAREAKGLSVEQVAAETRISQRYIEDIEADEYAGLPGRTYAIGFARTIAKVVGLDQGDVARLVREALDAGEPEDVQRGRQTFEPGDPARAPSRGLLWFSVIAAVLLLVGLFFAARLVFSPAAELPTLVEQQQVEQRASAAAAAEKAAVEAAPVSSTGTVVFTADGPAWVRFYDAQGNRLKEGEMAKGETFTVPAGAQGTKLITGRPDLLSITIDGKPVAKISDDVVTVSDVPVDAASLAARAQPAAAASGPAAPQAAAQPNAAATSAATQ